MCYGYLEHYDSPMPTTPKPKKSKSGSGLDTLPGKSSKPDAYERLRDAILSNELEPGTPLVESTLAKLFNVSRTPIREALTRLEQDALLARDRNRLVVRERTPDEILDIYEVRILLEVAVAHDAAERRTSHDVRKLQSLLNRWDSVDLKDDRQMLEVNREFHTALWRASHNESLVDLLARLSLHVARFPATTLSTPGRWEQAGKEHVAIVRALELRDADGAAELAREHFQHARDIRFKLWDSEN